MNYNDFPILSNEQYDLLQQNYSNYKTDRNTYINRILAGLHECKFTCLNIKDCNKNITLSISNTLSTIDLIINNLSNLTNAPVSYENTVKISNFNVFKFLGKLLNCLNLFHNWQNDESKDYFKNLANTYFLDLSKCLSNIISALEQSNVRLYKYM